MHIHRALVASALLFIAFSTHAGTFGEPATDVITIAEGAENSGAVPGLAVLPEGRFAVAWTQSIDGVAKVFMRIHLANGTPQTDAFQVADVAANVEMTSPSVGAYEEFIATDDSRIVVAWHEHDGTIGYSLRGRVFDMDGAPQGDPFTVSDNVSGSWGSDIAVTAFGSMYFTWLGDNGGDEAVFARILGYTGSPASPETLIATHATGSFLDPHISASTSDTVAIVWQNFHVAEDDYSLRASLLDKELAPIAEDIAVNQVAHDRQRWFDIVAKPNGGFSVVWDAISNGEDVFLRSFDSAGAPTGNETIVNATGAGDQRVPSVATDAYGRTYVAWKATTTSPAADLYYAVFDDDGGVLLDEKKITDVPHEYVTANLATDADGDAAIAFRHGAVDQVVEAQRFTGGTDVDLALRQNYPGSYPTDSRFYEIYPEITNLQSEESPTGHYQVNWMVNAATGARLIVELGGKGLEFYAIDNYSVRWICKQTAATVMVCDHKRAIRPVDDNSAPLMTFDIADSSVGSTITLTLVALENDPDTANNSVTINIKAEEATSSGGGGGTSGGSTAGSGSDSGGGPVSPAFLLALLIGAFTGTRRRQA